MKFTINQPKEYKLEISIGAKFRAKHNGRDATIYTIMLTSPKRFKDNSLEVVAVVVDGPDMGMRWADNATVKIKDPFIINDSRLFKLLGEELALNYTWEVFLNNYKQEWVPFSINSINPYFIPSFEVRV
jgi:hypothetical protein